MFSGQEMFDRIDKEEDGEVYIREVVDFLAVLDNNIEQSHQVRQEKSENVDSKVCLIHIGDGQLIIK